MFRFLVPCKTIRIFVGYVAYMAYGSHFWLFWLFRDGVINQHSTTLSPHSTTLNNSHWWMTSGTTRLKAPQVNDPLAPHRTTRLLAQVWWHPFYPTKKKSIVYIVLRCILSPSCSSTIVTITSLCVQSPALVCSNTHTALVWLGCYLICAAFV